MQNDWMLDVLTDLSAFARNNGLPDLAEQLDDTRVIAARELMRNIDGSRRIVVPSTAEGDERGVRDRL